MKNPIHSVILDSLPAVSAEEAPILNVSPTNCSAKILLIMPPPWGVDHPPMSLGYLTRYLKYKQIGYEVFDLNLALFHRSKLQRKALWHVENDHVWRNTATEEMISQLDGFEDLLSKIIKSSITIVGLSLIDPNQFVGCHVIKRIKRECPQKIIVVGGPVCATPQERKWLRDNTGGLIDFIIVEEGEKSLAALLKRLEQPLTNKEIIIPGVVDCRYSEDITPYTMGTPLDLSEISFPDYEGFPFESYMGNAGAVMWSRGCISNCAFCKEKSLWNKHRTRPIENILEELKFYKEKNIHEFVVYDSLVNGKPDHLESLCDAIISQKLNIRWSALAIPDKSLTKRLLEKMKLAGCFVLIFGLESGSEKILKRMRKRFLLKDAIETIINTKHAGIETAINIIVGFPGEDEFEFKKTLDFLRKYHGYIDRLDAVTPLQLVIGTHLFNHREKFDIRPPGGREDQLWSTNDGTNTYEIRMQRRKKIVETCNQYGIKIQKGFHTNNCEGPSAPKKIWKAQCEIDMLFLDPAMNKIPDYDTALVLEYLNQNNISTAYLARQGRAESDEDLLAELDNFAAKFLAVKMSNEQLDNALNLIGKVRDKNENLITVLWGPSCTTEDQIKGLPPNLVDAIIFQEYEKAFKELAFRSKTGRFDPSIPGIYVPGQPFTPLSPFKNLSKYPFPRYEGFDFKSREISALPLRFSKGCPYRCSFCSIYHHEGYFRIRKPKKIYEEICYHLNNNGISRYVFQDRAINGDPDVLFALCDLIIRDACPVTWSAKYIARERGSSLLKKIAAAGCVHLDFGYISGSESVLGLMGKPFNACTVENGLRKAHELGIRTAVHVMVGYPGEKEPNFMETVSFLYRNAPYIDEVKNISPCHLQPGSDLEMNPQRYGVILPHINPLREWHDGAYNNLSFRIKKQKELAIVLENLGLSPDLKPYLNENEEILAHQNKILKRYFGFLEQSGKCARMETHVSPGHEAEQNPVMLGIKTGTEVYTGPDLLEIDLTNNCNLQCIGCWCHSPYLGNQKFRGQKKVRHLPANRIFYLLEEAKSLGTGTIQLSGSGEPFLHPAIWQIIESIKKAGMNCNIITNFSLLDEKAIRQIINLKVNSITASIWAADADTYKRTHPGASVSLFRRIQENLALLTRLRDSRDFPRLKIYHVISAENSDGIDQMLDFALGAGADAVEFQMIDVVPGKTDFLRPDQAAKESLLAQFNNIKLRPDYTRDFIGTNHLKQLRDQILQEELMEFGRIYRSLPDGFDYLARHHEVIRCPDGKESVEKKISRDDFSVAFLFDRDECEQCGQKEQCWGNGAVSGRIVLHPMEILGVGPFIRRLNSSEKEIQVYERGIVDRLPCTVGWTYARVTVDGDVIPCCKASGFPLGNIHGDSLYNIWHAPPYSEFRQKALQLPKSDPYFAKINCYKSCDNAGMNMNTHLRFLNFQSGSERSVLQ